METGIPADRWEMIKEGRAIPESVTPDGVTPDGMAPKAVVLESPALSGIGEQGEIAPEIGEESSKTHAAVDGILRGAGDVGHNVIQRAGNALGSGVSQLLLGKGPDNDTDYPDDVRKAA